MSILKRVGNKVIVKGTPPVAAIPPWTEYRPDPAQAALYDDLFAIYQEAIEINAALGKRLAALGRASG